MVKTWEGKNQASSKARTTPCTTSLQHCIWFCYAQKERTLKTVIGCNIIYITPTGRPAKLVGVARASSSTLTKGLRVWAACAFDPKLLHLEKEFQKCSHYRESYLRMAEKFICRERGQSINLIYL